MWFCDNSLVRCLQVYGVIIVYAVSYTKYNLVSLLYSGALFVLNHEEINTILQYTG